jgi:hypothetical protein
MRRRFTAAALIPLLMLPVLRAEEISPGSTHTVVFRNLPQTLWSLGQPLENKKPPAFTVWVPEDYSPARSYPLMVYMGGARGESGHDINHLRSFMGTESFILVSFPLFKNTDDIARHREVPTIHQLAIDPGQSELLWSAYEPMLKRLFALIPNIDPEKTFFGGFSNGAHATAVLLNDPVAGPELRKYFNLFYFVEGGHALRLSHALPDADLLFMQGEQRAPWLEKVASPLRWNVRIGVEVRTMPGIGHAFPVAEKAWLRGWIQRKCRE